MGDKDVGDLWRLWRNMEDPPGTVNQIVGLIRKLVEERTVVHRLSSLANIAPFGQALRDFGISESEWK